MPTSGAEQAVSPSWNLLIDLQVLFQYHFMQNAFLAGTAIALAAGAVGYFMVLRGQSFAGHTLASVGFAGAAGALLVGISPLLGLLVFGIAAALGIGVLGGEPGASGEHDVAVGATLAFCLGLGLLFLRLGHGFVENAYSLLFGSVLGISDADLRMIAATALVTLVALSLVARPLLYASLDPDVAAGRGLPVRGLALGFLLLLAFAVAQAVQVVGVLLIFALLITPAAIAQQVTARPWASLALSVLLALVFTWLGLTVAYFAPYPVSFFLTTFAFAGYALVYAWRGLARLPARFPRRSAA